MRLRRSWFPPLTDGRLDQDRRSACATYFVAEWRPVFNAGPFFKFARDGLSDLNHRRRSTRDIWSRPLRMAEMRQCIDEVMAWDFESSVRGATGVEAVHSMNTAVFGYRDCGSNIEQYEKYASCAFHWREESLTSAEGILCPLLPAVNALNTPKYRSRIVD
jgi:hypothetical protein